MKKVLIIFVVCLCLILCSSDNTIAVLATPRAILVLALVLWLRCEHCMRQNRGTSFVHNTQDLKNDSITKENYELSQSIMNLSNQHTLLCEIRTAVSRTLRYTKDVLVELKFPSPKAQSRRASLTPSPLPSPEFKPNADKCYTPSRLSSCTDTVLRKKAMFLRGSMSEGNISTGISRTEQPNQH